MWLSRGIDAIVDVLYLVLTDLTDQLTISSNVNLILSAAPPLPMPPIIPAA